MIFTDLTGRLFAVLAKEDLGAGFFDAFDFSKEGASAVLRIIFAFAAGIVLASIWSVYNKRYLGGLARKLLSEGASSPETAKNLYEIGFDDKLGVRHALRRGHTYSGCVVCVEEEEYLAQMQRKKQEFEAAHADQKKKPKFKYPAFKPDLDVMHYYIPEEKQFVAETRFSAKGANFIGILIVLILLAIILIAATILVPKILEFLGVLTSSI